MDVCKRIEEIMEQKQLSYYKLAIRSGLAQSTLANIRHRGTIPTIFTIEQVCKGLQISLSEFFLEDTTDAQHLESYQVELLQLFMLLSHEKRNLIITLIRNLL